MRSSYLSSAVRVGAIAAALAALVGCSEAPEEAPTRIVPTDGVDTGSSLASSGDQGAPHTIVLETTPTTEQPWTPTTTGPPSVLQPAPAGVCPGEGPIDPRRPPTGLAEAQAALNPAIADPRFRGSNLSVSIWIDGWGQVVSLNTDLTFPPASNQKLITAAGAYERLDTNERVRTVVIGSGPVVDGVLRGDVVLVGGGDPTVTRSGIRSLDALATQLRARGVTKIDGKVLVDESRFDPERFVPTWPSGWQSTVGGPLSALVVDRNRNVDPADPSLSIGEFFKASLVAAGMQVDGEVAHGKVDTGEQVAVLDGPTYSELIAAMLQTSDNLTAELLVKEIGLRHSGAGTTAAGLASVRDAVAVLCVPPGGADVDGSGLSSANSHSADQFRRLLQVATERWWGSRLRGALPVAGQSGTLAGRLIGPYTTGNVRAKTGSIATSKALSGYLSTMGGRQAYFSILVNGNATGGLEPAIDNVVAQIAALQN